MGRVGLEKGWKAPRPVGISARELIVTWQSEWSVPTNSSGMEYLRPGVCQRDGLVRTLPSAAPVVVVRSDGFAWPTKRSTA